MSILAAILAIAMAATILVRVVCVLHQTSPKKHSHPALFIGFGYSYVVLGAGAICGAIGLVTDLPGYEHAGIWLLLLGSCGLIVFDRRARRCWTVTTCPIDPDPANDRPRPPC